MTSYLSILFCLTALSYQISELPEWAEQRFVPLSETFGRSNQLNPSFIEYDLNNDKISDIALFVRKKVDSKTGILFLINGQENQFFLAGAGNSFGPSGNDFEWADSWQVFNEKVTYEMTFLANGDIEGEREVIPQNPAISIREDEGSGGLIYFNGSKALTEERLEKSETIRDYPGKFPGSSINSECYPLGSTDN